MNASRILSERGLAILLFHGVVEESDHTVRNYTCKHMEKDRFYRLMQQLKQEGQPVSMGDVIARHTEGRPYPPQAFAVTFDDGFENNYSIAAPMLRDLGIPATFYVTTDFVEHNTMSWIDRIEYCLEATGTGCVHLPWEQDSRLFSNAGDKIALLDYLRHVVKLDGGIDADGLADDLCLQWGLGPVAGSDDPLDLKMNWQQVRQLDGEALFTVGGHTHRHMILAYLGRAELHDEIGTSIRLLKGRAGICSPHYSYPEGLAHCYSDEVIDVLKNHGIDCCPTAEEGINRAGDSLFHLKRTMVT